MTGLSFAALVRNYTRTNSTTFPDSEIVLLANAVKDEFAPEIMKADEDVFGVLATRDLVASDSSDFTLREYSLPDDLMAIEAVEARLNGSDWLKLFEIDLSKHRRPTDESTAISYYSNNPGEAYYDIFRNSLWLYSGAISASTAGLKLWYISYPADISTGTLAQATDLSIDPSTTSSQLPRSFHELWARRVSIIWKSNKDKPIPLNEREQTFERDFKNKVEALTNFNKERSNLATIPNDLHLQA